MAERVADPVVQAAPEPTPAAPGTATPALSGPAAVLGLQRAAGNAAVTRYLAGGARPPPPSAAQRRACSAPHSRGAAGARGGRGRAPARGQHRSRTRRRTPIPTPTSRWARSTRASSPSSQAARWARVAGPSCASSCAACGAACQSAPADQVARIDAKFDDFGVLDAMRVRRRLRPRRARGPVALDQGAGRGRVDAACGSPTTPTSFLLAEGPRARASSTGRGSCSSPPRATASARGSRRPSTTRCSTRRRACEQLSGFLDGLKQLGLVEGAGPRPRRGRQAARVSRVAVVPLRP